MVCIESAFIITDEDTAFFTSSDYADTVTEATSSAETLSVIAMVLDMTTYDARLRPVWGIDSLDNVI